MSLDELLPLIRGLPPADLQALQGKIARLLGPVQAACRDCRQPMDFTSALGRCRTCLLFARAKRHHQRLGRLQRQIDEVFGEATD